MTINSYLLPINKILQFRLIHSKATISKASAHVRGFLNFRSGHDSSYPLRHRRVIGFSEVAEHAHELVVPHVIKGNLPTSETLFVIVENIPL